MRSPHTATLPKQFIAILLVAAWAAVPSQAAADEGADAARIDRLLAQLDDDDAQRRDEAEQELVKLGVQGGAAGGEKFLARLPKPSNRMPPEMRTRLARAISKIQAQLARAVMDATRLTIDVEKAPLGEVLATIEQQSGNNLSDHRGQFGQDEAAKEITLDVKDEPFWPVLDKLLDAAGMSPYPFSGEEGLALVERPPGVLRRFGRAAYSGPFRIEGLSVAAERGLRSPDQSVLRVELEIAWEPRLRPIALTQAAADLKVVCDDGLETPPLSVGAVFDVEITPGSHAAEVTLPLQLPARRATMLKSIRGKMTALVPGRIVDLEFDDLVDAKNVSQEAGGVTVTIDRVAKNRDLWEVHMRIRIESLDEGLASHRSWVFQNIAFLKDKGGETIDHAGFETTMQSEQEAGFAYLFELPEGVEMADCTWIYRTPAAIVETPIEYELSDIPLP